jgi:orotate phosphoribosyltransferase
VLVVEDVITTGGSVKEVMDLVEESGGNIMGVVVFVDRSNGQANLHSKQFSIVEMDAVSYSAEEIPEDLAAIPIQKPGSRYSI